MVILNKGDMRIKIVCPSVPNYINVDEKMRPLSYLSEKDLEVVAEEWLYKLKSKRKQQLEHRE